MIREKAVARLDDMMFDEDPLIRRAACEALLNCLYSEEIYNMVGWTMDDEGFFWGS